MIIALLGVIPAVLLEAAIWPVLRQNPYDYGNLAAALTMHLAASALMALLVVRLLPTRYSRPVLSSWLFLFLLQVGLPGAGILISALLLYALHKPRPYHDKDFDEHPIPDLPFEPLAISRRPVYSLGGLRAILKHAVEPNKRLAAVMATRNMPDKEAIPILRLALTDLEDDVRLLAYSLLDGKENAINQQIHELQHSLRDQQQQHQHWRIQRQLADRYWELSYLGLAQGELRQYVLSRAAHYARLSLSQRPSEAARVFLGRIYLAQGHLQEARDCLEQAEQSGIARRHVLPYLAEVAFYQRRYPECKAYLANLPPQQRGSALQQLREYWHD